MNKVQDLKLSVNNKEKEQDRQDRLRRQDKKNFDVTEQILKCSFDVMNELGVGFLEGVYKKALMVAFEEKSIKYEVEKRFEIRFHEKFVGLYIADLVVEDTVIVELKCCKELLPEHQAQLINYLKASGVYIGLLLNFGKRKLEMKRAYHPSCFPVGAADPVHPV